MLSKPNIYLSITTTDLGESRALARDVLMHLQCTPVEPPRDLPASAAEARKLLHKQIAACDTVVCIVGKHYGPEPAIHDDNEPRRSYRQLEYDIAQELSRSKRRGKRVITFICDDDYDYDAQAPGEPEELRHLQQAHRVQLLSGQKIFTPVANSAALEKDLYKLQEFTRTLAHALERARRRTRWTVAAAVLAVLLLGAGLWLLAGKMSTTDTTVGAIGKKINQLNAELDQMRGRVDAVAKAYVQDQPEADRLNIPPDEQFKNAIAKVAGQENIPPALLSAQIQVFVKNTTDEKNNAAASELDRARADFAARNFSAAAAGATRAALALRVQRLAAAEAASAGATEAGQLRQKAGEVKTFVDELQTTASDTTSANTTDAAAPASNP